MALEIVLVEDLHAAADALVLDESKGLKELHIGEDEEEGKVRAYQVAREARHRCNLIG